jgi:hypothetical protein
VNTRGLFIFFGIPVLVITILLFVNNLAFLGADNMPKNTQASQSSESSNNPASLPSDTDSIALLFQAINQKNSAITLAVMDPTAIQTEADKKGWAEQFAAFEKVELKSIEVSNKDAWKDNEHIYKIVVNAKMTAASAKAMIPYYGWGDGDNTKWVTVRKGTDELWRVVGFASGM